MKKIKALMYAMLGIMMSVSTFRQGSYWMTAGIAFFAACAIAVTLNSIGRLEITWDELGVTLKKSPKPRQLLLWSEMQKLKVDHLGYHIKTKQANFRISQERMPKELLQLIRRHIRKNQPPQASPLTLKRGQVGLVGVQRSTKSR
ncbi:MAG TPA: hypothetical protein DD423_05665 [Opitutae bacterium]|jgi:hypothetical protein|nr:hypothetical protein [Opitutae bacterium]